MTLFGSTGVYNVMGADQSETLFLSNSGNRYSRRRDGLIRVIPMPVIRRAYRAVYFRRTPRLG